MRVATLYDIHGDLPALEAVLRDIEELAVDCIVVGGDALTGPMPVETLKLLETLDADTRFIHGSGESDVLRYLETGASQGMTPRADEMADG